MVFDMDGVLVDIKSSWTHVHRSFGVDASANFRAYRNGKIDYAKFMRLDIGLWGKVHVSRIEAILLRVPLMRGARRTVLALRARGIRTLVVSAGISILAERLQRELHLDSVLANGLITDGAGFLTGEGEERVPLLDKAGALRTFASTEGVDLSTSALVADSVYDLPMFELVEKTIAFNSDDELVTRQADVVIPGKNLKRILEYL